jgi:hypothetical protein
MAVKSSATTALRYAYLHGFASSPLSTKGVQLHRWFQKELGISLDLPDLNIPSFRKQCLSNMVDHIEKKIISKNYQFYRNYIFVFLKKNRFQFNLASYW